MNRLLIADEVQVTAGNSKGQKGKIAAIDYERGRVVIEGINLRKRHMKPTPQTNGGIIEIPGPIALSNIMPLDPESGKPTRVHFEERDGKKERVAKSGAIIPTRRGRLEVASEPAAEEK
ncbi:MAG: 50S ribosomal protein L24 [Polyangiaceae bacterium]|nr:50S ribosomal protein L24 [Polyangiaceae bacterium]